MNVFTINLIFAGLWAAFVGEFSIGNLAAGYLLGFVSLWAARPLFRDDRYFLRFPRLVRLAVFFLWELVVSSFKVAADVLAIRPGNRPGIIAVPIRTRTETGTLVLSSLVSLTPGSLSLDLSEDGETLYVHAMFVDDPAGVRADMRKLEDPVLEAVE